MTDLLSIHPHNPQRRLLTQGAALIRAGGVVVYPTDSTYALGCHIGDKGALERMRAIRRLDRRHLFTLVCRDLSEISSYARVNNASYRILKHYTPGPFTFLLTATREVPRRLTHPKRRTIGLRIPDHAVALGLLEELGEPLMSTSLILPNDSIPLSDAQDIVGRLAGQVDLVIDSGTCGLEPTTVVDLTGELPAVVRPGVGRFE
jgi:tRNA threonylcarbamoyl adenosine modification protein (Sua5/YciO/YrdC/YwlC family)